MKDIGEWPKDSTITTNVSIKKKLKATKSSNQNKFDFFF
jgi:hypothetical protein